ncbi:MAG: hypothetical protein ACOYM2_02485 [Rectinemataceae bacterium]
MTARAGGIDLGGISGSSLNLEGADVAELFLMPVVYGFSGPLSSVIQVALGAYVCRNANTNIGFFKLSDSVAGSLGIAPTNSYEQASESIFLGPALSLETSLGFGPLSLDPRLVLVPAFASFNSLSLAMDPLYASQGKGSIPFTDFGLPYVAVSASGTLFGAVGLDLDYEFSRQNTRMIRAPDSTHSDWWGKPDTLRVMSFRAIANLLLPVAGGKLTLGAGPSFTTTHAGDGSQASSTRPVFNIGYDFAK